MNPELKIIHNENNIESQEHFDKNERRFSHQCEVLFEALLRGERLTFSSVVSNYSINAPRRRFKDLIDTYGIPVQKEWKQSGETKCKEYFLTQEFIDQHKEAS